jgi:ribosome recycling factor
MIEESNDLKKETVSRLDKSIIAFEKDLSTIRTGRASPNILDNIFVDSYGSMVKLEQVGTISVPEPRLITISVWDKSMIIPVEAAIKNSNIGINPQVDGTKIKLPIPSLTEETRKELVKKASEYAEKSRVAIRQIRKSFMDDLKKMEKDKKISEDEFKIESDNFEKNIKSFNDKIEIILDKKSKEIMQI